MRIAHLKEDEKDLICWLGEAFEKGENVLAHEICDRLQITRDRRDRIIRVLANEKLFVGLEVPIGNGSQNMLSELMPLRRSLSAARAIQHERDQSATKVPGLKDKTKRRLLVRIIVVILTVGGVIGAFLIWMDQVLGAAQRLWRSVFGQ